MQHNSLNSFHQNDRNHEEDVSLFANDQQQDKSDHSPSPNTHNFTVAVRLKPKESSQQNVKIVLNKNGKEMYIESSKNMRNIYNGSKCKNFKMDSIINEYTSNSDIFKDIVKDKLSLLKTNCNIAVMAYGATNSGKTYTIFGQQRMGNKHNQGLAFLSSKYLMEQLFKERHKFYFSYLEIYNQNVQDLLIDQPRKHYLNIFEDHTGKVNIPDLTKIQVQNYTHLCQLIQKGNRIRAQSSNNVNNVSSRSHAILQLDIFSIQDSDFPQILDPVQVNFMIIDLAGSEKSSPYFQQSQQLLLKEGSNINRSLLALGNCIKHLANGDTHIPYRDSKLTRILKDNLSGYCHNLLIACISQTVTQYEESISTLLYASKACKIQTISSFAGLKDRAKFVEIACQHCKMKIDFGYICNALKHRSYQIVDLLSKQVKPQQINLAPKNCINDHFFNYNLSNEQLCSASLNTVNILKQLKKQKLSQIDINQLVLELQKMKQNIKKQETIKIHLNQPVEQNLISRKNSSSNSRPILKMKKELPKNNSQITDKSILKQPKKSSISIHLKQNNETHINRENSKVKLKFLTKYPPLKQKTKSKQNKQKDCNNILIQDEQPPFKQYSSINFSSINSKRDDIMHNQEKESTITPFTGELSLDMSGLYSRQERSSFYKQQIDKDFDGIKHFKRKRYSEPKDVRVKQPENDINQANIEFNNNQGSKTFRDVLTTENQIKNSTIAENKIVRRMKPDSTNNQQSIFLQKKIGLQKGAVCKQMGAIHSRSKIKLIAKLR